VDQGHEAIAEAANRLAGQLPGPLVRSLADAILDSHTAHWPTLQARIAGVVPHALYRTLAVEFLGAWKAKAAGLSPEVVALALLTAAQAKASHRAEQNVELVWTGPGSGASPFRSTEQVVLQVIDSASQRLLVISYAVFNVPRISEALIRAADRGVAITVVVESPDRIAGRKAYSTLAALGPTVAGRCGVYLWPIEERFKGGTGKPGLLHVKCAVADGRWLFLSSANLTEQAFSINMELGVLVTGGTSPVQVEAHFARLIEVGTLVKA
jgi:phosphatidylserine/phosphatidylglycerophosphate/cardiolipin synthase-like enzyme